MSEIENRIEELENEIEALRKKQQQENSFPKMIEIHGMDILVSETPTTVG